MSTKPKNTVLKLDPQHNSSDAEPASSLGKFLQRERKEKHLSLKEIAETTCIHIETLRALEKNDAKKLPAEVFARGFVRLYLKQLDIDPQPILDRYMPKNKQEWGSTREDSDEEQKYFSAAALAESTPFLTPKRVLFLVIAFVAGILIFWIYQTFRSTATQSSDLQYEQIFEKYPATDITTHETDITIRHDESEDGPVTMASSFENQTATEPEPPGKTEEEVSRKRIPKPEPPVHERIATQNTKQPSAELETTEKNAARPAPVHTESTAEPSSESIPPQKPHTLPQLAGTDIPAPADESPALSGVDIKKKDRREKIEYAYLLKAIFTETTWIQITVDDKPPRDAIYKAGSRRIWRAREKIDLHIGNAGGVNLTLNGSPVANLGPSGQSAKLSIPKDLAP